LPLITHRCPSLHQPAHHPNDPILPCSPPTQQTLPIPEGLDPHQRAAAEADWQFLLQLLDNRRVGDYEVPVPLKVRSDLI